MSAHAVTLHLPTSLYDYFTSRAAEKDRSLEAEVLEAVAGSALAMADDSSRLPTGRDLAASELVGMWEDRAEVQDSSSFARTLRDQAQNRA